MQCSYRLVDDEAWVCITGNSPTNKPARESYNKILTLTLKSKKNCPRAAVSTQEILQVHKRQ